MGNSLTNSCAAVNAAFIVDGTNYGTINTCLCRSMVIAFLQTNPAAIAAVVDHGFIDTRAAVIALIAASSPQTCTYPLNGFASCTMADPCNFDCTNGFTPTSDSCVCNSPNQVCNGMCTPLSCASQAPMKRDGILTGRSVPKPIGNWWDSLQCKGGHTPCGTYGGRTRGYECIDVENDLESCGGCVLPLHDGSPVGADCTAIEGVTDVMCSSGACVVLGCRKGWAVSSNGSTCVENQGHSVEGIPKFTLDHLPLASVGDIAD